MSAPATARPAIFYLAVAPPPPVMGDRFAMRARVMAPMTIGMIPRGSAHPIGAVMTRAQWTQMAMSQFNPMRPPPGRVFPSPYGG